MALTARQVVLALVRYCGVVSLDPADPTNNGVLRVGLTPGLIDDAVTAINGALQEIHDVSPCSMYYRRVGTYLNPPTNVSINVTNNSQAITVVGWQDWMVGCSVKMGGDMVVNEFLDQQTLRRPYTDATAAGLSCIVYNDCIIANNANPDVIGIKDPVEIPQIRMLIAAGTRKEFQRYEWNPMLGDDYHRMYARFAATPKIPAQPIAYLVDTEATPTGMQIRLAVLPIPDQRYNLEYGVITNSISISPSDVGSFGPDPWFVANLSFNIPGSWDESVLLPMALKRFSANPMFGNGNPLVAAEIDRQHKKAVVIMQQSAPNRAPIRMTPIFR